jgi:phosphoglycolate phosphatase-like HAD superfamily hydrolase
MKLILFDIDGTLIDSGGAGTRALNLAFEELFSIRDAFQGIRMSGKTDTEIMREALGKHGLPSWDGTIPMAVKAYLKHLGVQIHNNRRRLKPGVQDLLDTLSRRPDCRLGLLTGNLAEGARIKLGAFGLNKYFSLDGAENAVKGSQTPIYKGSETSPDNLEGSQTPIQPGGEIHLGNPDGKGDCDPERGDRVPFGAFGSDDEDRNVLLPIAVERLRDLTGIRVGYADCVVIGDTPRDVRCAKPYGAVSVAVATGGYSMEELREAGADMVMEDLTRCYDYLAGIM